MAEAASGKSYEELLQLELFSPLGISGTLGWPAASDPNQPWGHYEEGGNYLPHDPSDEYFLPPCVVPAGDVSMSIGDYADFVQWHLRAMRGTPAILSAESFTVLHTPIGGYAKGWGVSTIDGVLTYAHEGSAGTFDVLVAIQPEHDLAVTVFINAAGTQSLNALNAIALEVLGIDAPNAKLIPTWESAQVWM
jgi:CubicO group peptidase (beta-lactamase class C family)